MRPFKSDHAAMHASAPPRYGCADCEIEHEPCPTCYAVWWQKRHPNIIQIPAWNEHISKAKLWLWKNFVDGRPEYCAFDNPYPINLDNGDPQTLGEPCGYALFKPSRQGRTDIPEDQVIAAIKRAAARSSPPPQVELTDEEIAAIRRRQTMDPLYPGELSRIDPDEFARAIIAAYREKLG